MKINKIFTTSSLSIALLFVTAFHTTNLKARTYFGCPSGFTHQVDNNASRCFRASSKSVKPPNACMHIRIPVINKSIGHYLRKNKVGNADKCVGTFKIGPVTNENVVNLSCRRGYSLKINTGYDKCEKRIPPSAEKPSVRVVR